MYAGSAYAAAPYAGGATTTTTTVDFDAAATRFRTGGGIYIEQDFTAPLPETNAHRYVVALVYPTWEPGTGSSGGTIGGFTPEGYGVGAYGFGPYGE